MPRRRLRMVAVRTLAFLATLTIAFGFGRGLLGEVFVRLVDAAGEIVASDLLGYVSEVDGGVVLHRLGMSGDFTDEMGRADDALLLMEVPEVKARVEEIAYYAADDIRARNDYLASR